MPLRKAVRESAFNLARHDLAIFLEEHEDDLIVIFREEMQQLDNELPEETIEILRGVRNAYEEHHRLTISDEALDAAAHLSARYVTERFLPDKAIDLIDEASSRVRMYKSPAAQTFKELMLELKDVKALRNEAVQNGRNDDALELSNKETDLKARIEKLRSGWDRATSPVVSPDDIAELVSMWTGVPVMQLATEESERLLHMEDELRHVSNVAEELANLIQEKDRILGDLREKALALSGLRQRAAILLKEAVDAAIHDLNMPHAYFFAHFLRRCSETENDYGPKGGDEIEFYLAANAGEDMKPLNKIASGGELSRIILALKNVLARTGSVATIIFDEVDNGIGGATAEIVGRKLKDVSANHQVICITHLPQIACYGEEHLYVSKKVAKGRTTTSVEKLSDEQKVEEISRMLGGVDVTETTRKHAREMISGSKISQSGKEK